MRCGGYCSDRDSFFDCLRRNDYTGLVQQKKPPQCITEIEIAEARSRPRIGQAKKRRRGRLVSVKWCPAPDHLLYADINLGLVLKMCGS